MYNQAGRSAIMRGKRGFTLLEVLTATAVVSILMPVIGLVFYQLMVIPPEENEHLTLANEVGLLASWLYRDGYMADNFSAGEAPYFGNFSWTDNSSDTHYFISYYSSNNQIMREKTVTSNYSTTSSPIVTSDPIALSRHITSGNFSFEQGQGNLQDNLKVNITANSTTSMGKALVKELTLYIMPRPLHVETTEGGIWGRSPILVGGGSSGKLVLEGKRILLNGNIHSNGIVTVDGNFCRVTETLECQSLIDNSDPDTGDESRQFRYRELIEAPEAEIKDMPDIGVPEDFLVGNISEPFSEIINDIDHEYLFNYSVNLGDVDEVWKNNNPNTKTLKPGMYYSSGTITISGKGISGAVTLIADRIIIENPGGTGLMGNQIELEPYYKDLYYEGLLCWATGSYGSTGIAEDGAILITGSDASWYPCVRIEGTLFAPNGEIELAGSGATLDSWEMASFMRGAMVGESVTISGDDWFIYRW